MHGAIFIVQGSDIRAPPRARQALERCQRAGGRARDDLARILPDTGAARTRHGEPGAGLVPDRTPVPGLGPR